LRPIGSNSQVVVKAYDNGEPSLASTATVTVFVEHLVTIPPDAGVGFAETETTAEVPENSPKNYLVKRLAVVNRPPPGAPFSCAILSGNEKGQTSCEKRKRNHTYINQINKKQKRKSKNKFQ
jgi:protocadherin-15